jgi:hypothetical protein
MCDEPRPEVEDGGVSEEQHGLRERKGEAIYVRHFEVLSAQPRARLRGLKNRKHFKQAVTNYQLSKFDVMLGLKVVLFLIGR